MPASAWAEMRETFKGLNLEVKPRHAVHSVQCKRRQCSDEFPCSEF